jgi:hypothetical protein
MKQIAMTDGPRLTIREMKGRDWVALDEALPREEACNELQMALKWFAWGHGWLAGDRLRSSKTGNKYRLRVWKALAAGPYQVGPFRVERAGRWGIQFAIGATYAAERAPKRRTRRDQTPWELGFAAGERGSPAYLCSVGEADHSVWYSGYVFGLAKRTNTARARRLARTKQLEADLERRLDAMTSSVSK